MGALAQLFKEAGHRVTGSDTAFDPPIGDALRDAGVETLLGYDERHLQASGSPDLAMPDLVVVGNVVPRTNREAIEAERLGLKRTSMSAALRDYFLIGRTPLVVAGTHGKTTTSSMCAWVLDVARRTPGYFIGGVPKNLPRGAAIGDARRRIATSAAALIDRSYEAMPTPFVVEGDEYDAVYWRKKPKFLDYIGVGDRDVAIVTSIEFDHIDAYRDVAAYENAFREFVRSVPATGLIVAAANDPRVVAIVSEEALARVSFYALQGDETFGVTPTWLGAPSVVLADGAQTFDLFTGGASCGRLAVGVGGVHNVRNAIAALAACAEGFGVPVQHSRAAIASFTGVRRRLDLLGSPGGILVYDDFAHHPTAVRATLSALRDRHPNARIWAIFEPRSATACRNLHQDDYARAFDAADQVILAPLGRSGIADSEKLDLRRLATELPRPTKLAESSAAILELLCAEARQGDVIAILSNGSFGGLHAKLIAELEKRHAWDPSAKAASG